MSRTRGALDWWVHVDVFSLQRLMGHADVTTTRRYLDQTDADITAAHRRAGPVDNML